MYDLYETIRLLAHEEQTWEIENPQNKQKWHQHSQTVTLQKNAIT